jgi:phage gpG-like protein
MTKLTINTQALNDLEKQLKKVLNTMPTVIGQTSVNHFQENITKRQGVPTSGSLQRFKSRVFESNRGRSKGILNDTGNLVDSIKIISRSSNCVNVGIRASEIPYAELHQHGGKISVTDKMRKFFWAKHYEHASSAGRSRGKRSISSSREANFWKAMALKKKNSMITIPKRQFMAVTPDLEKTILRTIKTEMNQII